MPRLFAFTKTGGSFPAKALTRLLWSAMLLSLASSTLAQADIAPQPIVNSVAFGNNRYVAVSDFGLIYHSPNLSDWSFQKVNSRALFGIAYGAGRFVAVGDAYRTNISSDSGLILTSTNGVDWLATTYSNRLLNVSFVGETFIVATEAESLLISTDGVIWRTKIAIVPYRSVITSAGFFGGKFYVSGGDVSSGVLVTSTDLESWTRISFGRKIYQMAHGQGITVAAAEYNSFENFSSIFVSSNQGWNEIRLPSPVGFPGVAYGHGAFVAVGNQGKILRSTNAVNWSAVNSGTDRHLDWVTFVNNRFFSKYDSGIHGLITSEDGTAWSPVIFNSVLNPRITAISRSSENRLRISAEAPLDVPVILEMSNDLQTWLPTGTAQASAEFDIPIPANIGSSLYRIRTAP